MCVWIRGGQGQDERGIREGEREGRRGSKYNTGGEEKTLVTI
jgi:hypothetical protein